MQWIFTPAGHPAHPAVVKRTALERNGTGLIDLAALCYGAESDCYRLLDDFRQRSELATRAAQPQRVTLDVGIALNDHDRVRVKRLVAEEGKAAEIRMDDVLKIVIVPTIERAPRRDALDRDLRVRRERTTGSWPIPRWPRRAKARRISGSPRNWAIPSGS